MPRRAAVIAAGDHRSTVRDQTNEIILARARAGQAIFLFSDLVFGVGEGLFSGSNAGAFVILRVLLALATLSLLVATWGARARARAVPLALLGVALGCLHAVGPGLLRGDTTTPVFLVVALGAGVSAVVPWGVRAQLVAVGIASLAAVGVLAYKPGPLVIAALVSPVPRAGIAFGASLYIAYLLRRNLSASIEREIERSEAAAALRASEEQLRHQLTQLDALYRTAPIGLSLVDTDLRFVRINKALADINGLPIEAHIGRNLCEVLPEMADIIEPIYRRVIATGEPVLGAELSGTTPRQPGIVREWRTDYWPIRSGHGAVVAVSCVVQEITEQKRAQEALRQNEERLRIVSQATNDAVWDWNLATDAVWWNDGLRTLFGYGTAEVGLYAAWRYDTIHPDDRDQVVFGLRALVESGEEYWSAEYRFRRANGTYAAVFDRGYVFHDTEGAAVRMIGALMDISVRKRTEEELARLNAELEQRVGERTAQLEATNRRLEHEMTERQQAAEALRESQRQLQDILDNTTAVIYLKDTQGRYLLINQQYEALFHLRRENVVGQTDFDMFPPAVAEALCANDRAVLAADRALVFEENVPSDGTMHTYISVKFPLRDPAGVPYGVCGISTDITARKQMEAELHASQAQLSAIFESTTDAIWSVDRNCRLTAFNSVLAESFGSAYDKPLQLGQRLEDRAPVEEHRQWQVLYERALQGERLAFERDYTTAGRTRAFLMSMAPIITDGQVTGATVFCKDITDLKRAEQRARQHQAELTHVLRLSTVGEMAAGLAHEINQPLGAIANYAQGCRRRLASSETRAEDLLPAIEEIAAQALRAGEIIKRLRHLVQKGEPRREAVDLNRIVADAARVIEPQTRHQGVALTLELAPGLPPIDGDTIQIEQVVLNLMLNGLEAMQPTPAAKAELTVTTALSDDGTAFVTVRDTGVGLNAVIAEKMFEPFFTSKASGLGMGLAISRSIVEEHGGRLWATNNNGRGATFHVALPLAPVRAASAG